MFDDKDDSVINGYENKQVKCEFGTSFTDYLDLNFEYNIENKELSIYGLNDNTRYKTKVLSNMSANGITQSISLSNKMSNYPIELNWKRVIDKDFNLLENKFENKLTNVNVWKYPVDSNEEFVLFRLELDKHRKLLKTVKEKILEYWYSLDITEKDVDNHIYQLTCEDKTFYNLKSKLKTNIDRINNINRKSTNRKR